MIVHNVTPDSFYPPSRYDESVFVSGADIVDIGGCSTRPGSVPVSEEVEWTRLEPVLGKLSPDAGAGSEARLQDIHGHPWPCKLEGSKSRLGRDERSEEFRDQGSGLAPSLVRFRHSAYPGGRPFILSIDTFRPGIARKAYELLGGVFILNDVGGPSDLRPSLQDSLAHVSVMASLCRELGLGYVATHNGPASRTYSWFESVAPLLEGVDWILDPGLGFGKDDARENWDLLSRLGDFRSFGRPIMVGASHKRFVRGSDELSRNALRLAAEAGATVFRVHDFSDLREG